MQVSAPESVNVMRQPEWRDHILAGTFMRVTCEQCGGQSVVEREFTYADFTAEDAGLFIGVFPRDRRPDHEACARVVAEAFRAAVAESPPAIRGQLETVEVRVCFGHAELREKVVCAAAKLDDRIVEAMKLAIFDAGPGADAAGVQMLYLVGFDESDGALWFAPHLDRPMTGDDPFLRVDRAMYDDFIRDRERIAALLAPLFSSAYVHAAHPALQS